MHRGRQTIGPEGYETGFDDADLRFPAFRAMLSVRERKMLMDALEDRAKALPHGGFEEMVDEVAKLERSLAVYELAKLRPA